MLVVYPPDGQNNDRRSWTHWRRGPLEALDIDHPMTVALTWREVVSVKAVEPWPSVHIEWRYPAGTDVVKVWAKQSQPTLDRLVEDLFGHLARFIPDKLEYGWLERPAAEWEPVDKIPESGAHTPQGAYRNAQEMDPIVAERPQPSPFASFLGWLATAGADARERPGRIVVTRDWVYNQTRRGEVSRISRQALTRVQLTLTGDAVYWFGRRTRLILTDVAGCPVGAALRQTLERGG